MTRISRALISVSDKTGIAELARALADGGVEILSTGGTARALRDAGITVTDVSDVTGFPEIMNGRVKTLHPKIHGGLLARRDRDHEAMQQHDIVPIDLLVVNLYPFERTVAEPGCERDTAIENIDIGGPAMIRAAAKNHAEVAVVTSPAEYDAVRAELEANAGALSAATRRRLAADAFAHTATYDAAIWSYLQRTDGGEAFPDRLPIALTKRARLRYGENPHQRAALYSLPDPASGAIVTAHQHQGKPLSYNNIADADAALECVNAAPTWTCVIVKHANPCGVGVGATALEAYEKAYRTDPTSAFGGIIALNTECDGTLARTIVARQFVEVIAAPAFTTEALQAFGTKPNIRVLETGPRAPIGPGLHLKQVQGGLLAQDRDFVAEDEDGENYRVVTARSPTNDELADALLAWHVARYVKSNAIVYCRDRATAGIGAGQMSRVMSARIAAWKAAEAGLDIEGAAMASDAFFPFRDGIDLAAEHGIAVVIQPGGSVRDEEVIAAANEHGMAMLFTGVRHFRH